MRIACNGSKSHQPWMQALSWIQQRERDTMKAAVTWPLMPLIGRWSSIFGASTDKKLTSSSRPIRGHKPSLSANQKLPHICMSVAGQWEGT